MDISGQKLIKIGDCHYHYESVEIHSKKKSTSEHLFWCFGWSQIEDSIEYLDGPKRFLSWFFQVLFGPSRYSSESSICDNLKHQERCSEVLFFLEWNYSNVDNYLRYGRDKKKKNFFLSHLYYSPCPGMWKPWCRKGHQLQVHGQ